ncbi:16S rRNA (uracil(1498)-N(3))-methyltransferase [Peptococcaceae bacterium 1198_IL3148]
MARFFVEPKNIKKNQAFITGQDAKHAQKVLRLKEGDLVTILDGVGNQFRAQIRDFNRELITCDLLEQQPAVGEPPIAITLAQCLPKADKMELVIQKGTELGVTKFIPIKCQRSVVKLDQKKGAERRERWQRVAMEAAKQCRRPMVPMVEAPMELKDLFEQIPADALVVMPYENETTRSLQEIVKEYSDQKNFYIIIGPEGGFDQEEVALAQQHGAKSISLGPRILRTETAGLAVISVIMYTYGDLG